MNEQAPVTEQELLTRANQLTGLSLQQLANQYSMTTPGNITHAKGWVGKLLEHALGATASSTPQPDFVNLNIELKTLPINRRGSPKESTYVCVVQLNPDALSSWEKSLVWQKLKKVLWVPYEADKDIPVPARRLGKPILWQPDTEQEQQLKKDWQESSDMIVMGELDKISASMGKYLQIRPKAANARMQTLDKNQHQSNAVTLPRGYYLRTTLTRQILTAST